jgi:hypothetical protein
MFANGELADIYRTDFLLAKEHNITLSEINDMVPFERMIYIGIIIDYLEKKQKAMRQF